MWRDGVRGPTKYSSIDVGREYFNKIFLLFNHDGVMGFCDVYSSLRRRSIARSREIGRHSLVQ